MKLSGIVETWIRLIVLKFHRNWVNGDVIITSFLICFSFFAKGQTSATKGNNNCVEAVTQAIAILSQHTNTIFHLLLSQEIL